MGSLNHFQAILPRFRGATLKICAYCYFQDMDMYTRVKRERRTVKRDMYGIPINEDSKDKSSSSSASDNDTDGSK